MEISKRLRTVAELVSGRTVADIGTDHGYVPLYLYEQGKIEKALACDINRGPLEKAKENIASAKAERVVEARLGSGLTPVRIGEVESAVIAGMGGMLICRILADSPQVVQSLRELILSPQHDQETVRRYVAQIGFVITEEKLVKEDEKYYHIFRCIPGKETHTTAAAYRYGGKLLEKQDAVLWEEMEKEERQYRQVAERLRQSGTEKAATRLMEVEHALRCLEEAKAWYR